MRKRAFGKTGVFVSEIALGGHEYMQDGRSRGFNEDMAKAVTPGYIGNGYGGAKRIQVITQAYDLGINLFDVTIDSEKEALGRNLKSIPPPYEVFIQTRPEGMCYSYDQGNRKLLDYQLLRNEVLRILKLIKRDAIDFFNVGLLKWSIEGDRNYLEKLSENLRRLKGEGLVRFTVADSFSGERLYLSMLQCGAFDAVNVDLNLGDAGSLEMVLPYARATSTGIIVREAFLKGELFRIGASAGINDRTTLAQLALKWVAIHGPNSIIVGVDNAEQLRNNFNSLSASTLTGEEYHLLEKLRATPEYGRYELNKRKEFHNIGTEGSKQ